MKVLLANPRGFCAGVDRAIEVVEKALEKHKIPIYVRNEVVHNKYVVKYLKQKGVIFVNNFTDVPRNAVVIFSAHGVSKKVKKEAKGITNMVYDATCPLVTKVHKEVQRWAKNNHQVILIGHKGHPEVEGTLGQAKEVVLLENIEQIKDLNFKQDKLSYTTQTTLSVDDTKIIVNQLKQKYPLIKAPKKDDICYATQNRQDAVKKIMLTAEMLLVLGSNNSSNSNRLREIALKMQKPAYLIDNASEIEQSWFDGVKVVGITAGASAPEILVQEVLQLLKAKEVVEVTGSNENINFAIPKELR